MPTIHLIIQGKVQGVFYRASAKKIATPLFINGWIRNKEIGDVEAVVTGDLLQLKKFVEWCRVGPTGAEVTDLIETALEEIAFESFTIRK